MKPNSSETSESAAPVVISKRSLFRSVGAWIVGVLALLVVAGLTAPMTLRCRKKSDQTEAVSNARQIGLALFEFQQAYGKFPDKSTIPDVRQNMGSHWNLGEKTSNDFFRQLIVSEMAQSEAMFYAKITGTRKPDGLVTDATALKKGECGFSYLVGLSADGNPARPLLVTPLIPGTDRFDPTRFDGKAIILKMDNSVTSMPIGKDGHVVLFGKNLLDPTNPVWGRDDKWVIAWPE